MKVSFNIEHSRELLFHFRTPLYCCAHLELSFTIRFGDDQCDWTIILSYKYLRYYNGIPTVSRNFVSTVIGMMEKRLGDILKLKIRFSRDAREVTLSAHRISFAVHGRAGFFAVARVLKLYTSDEYIQFR